ncbi:MAG: dienelactone hydrolase family protein [Proteobacteria bacterium]|nr:dienelactone hydrolase family protein [Pseudomonadota bacterium]
MKTMPLAYYDGNTELEGFLAIPEQPGKKPAVIVAHDWSGRNEFACNKAKNLAELGYIGFALDMFGKGKLGKTTEEKSALIQPFVQDRAVLRQRITTALEALKKVDDVDTHRIAVIGFCFGGLCALDLARSGADIKATVSFHGLLNPPDKLPKQTIKAKILALHGHDDPMVPPEQVLAFEQEMTKAQADWQVHVYGHTMHAFTNPVANDKNFGTVYEAKADKRSWRAMVNFFEEVL